MSSHEERVARVAAEVRARAGDRGGVSLGKAAVSHFVPNPRDPRHGDRKLDIRALREVLTIDATGRTCTAEPGVTFKQLVGRTLPLGLLPKLVPELETITLGGAVSGCSVESMSYKYGGFHDSCREYEIVTGTGEIVTCSRERDPELFERIHGSYGTLGILTKLTFDLVPAKPFVHLEYRRFASFDEYFAGMKAAMGDAGIDFIDGIVHGPAELVLCLGRMVDSAPRTSSYRFLQIYYKSTRAKTEDWLTLEDYLFRYDTECHWLTRTLPGMENKLVRLLLGKLLLGSTNLLTWSKRIRPVLKLKKHPEVVVDVFIPGRRFKDFFQWYAGAMSYWPLWVVPYRMPRPYAWIDPAHAAKEPDELHIDCAIYGMSNDDPAVNHYKTLEDKTFELGGVKTLISENYYSEQRFWEIYDRAGYQKIKQRTDPQGLFRDLYKKFHFLNDSRRSAASPADARSTEAA